MTGFLELVGTEHEVQFLVERIAQQLQFLAQLPLVHGEAELEEIERGTVSVEAGIPVHFAIGGDRFERDAVGQVEVDHSETGKRCVGKECGSTGRSRWSPDNKKKKQIKLRHTYT